MRPSDREPRIVIDLNADVGEGSAADSDLLEVITSANVACGFHAGDASTMQGTCAAALARDVRVGAHVSYLDREGFGRRKQDPEPPTLTQQVMNQLAALDENARAVGASVRYVKPHGALYNRCLEDPGQADAVTEAIRTYDASLNVLVMPASALAEAAGRAGLTAVAEGFADRRYRSARSLMPRAAADAVLSSDEAVAQARAVVLEGRVQTTTGWVPTTARSLCVHSDTPGAVELGRAVRDALIEAGAELRPFA